MARNMVSAYHNGGLYQGPIQTHHQDGGGLRGGCRGSDVFRSMDSDHQCNGGMASHVHPGSVCSARTDIYGRIQDSGQCTERFQMQLHNSNLFGGLDDGFLSRAEALSGADISKASPPLLMKHDSIYGSANGDPLLPGSNGGQHLLSSRSHLHGFPGPDSMLNPIMTGGLSSPDQPPPSCMSVHAPQMYAAAGTVYTNLGGGGGGGGGGPGGPNGPIGHGMLNHVQHHHHHHHHQSVVVGGALGAVAPHGVHCSELDCDPRELEAFAEHFKQRRIKLGATQADVGAALGKLKLPGVGSLSQSTICRFESLTLSHNNMVALKPVLSAWLAEAERAAHETKMREEMMNGASDKKRKRTSIAGPEKRSLEAYFAIQPRPSGEKIAQIADKLDLKKNVVRVWFCNQRQKQKRMKFSASTMKGPH